MQFKIRGKYYDISPGDVLSAARGSPPNLPDGRNKYCLSFEGENYPIKQLIRLVTKLPYVAFTAQDAHRILSKLGFEIKEFDDGFGPAGLSVEQIAPRSPDGDYVRFAVALEEDEDGFIVASCPTLSGCNSQGRTRQEALRNIAEAIRGYAASMKKHGEEIPKVDWEVVEVEL